MAFRLHRFFLIVCCSLLFSQVLAKSTALEFRNDGIFDAIGSAILGTIKDCHTVADNIGSQVIQCITDGLDTVEKIKIPQIVADGLSTGGNIANHVGQSVMDTISSNKLVGNIGSTIQNVAGCLENVKDISQHTVNGLENVKNISQNIACELDLIKNITHLIVNEVASEDNRSFTIAAGKIVLKVTKDMFLGKKISNAIVDRTIKELSKMDSIIAFATKSVLKRVQMIQNGNTVGMVLAEISSAIVRKCLNKFKSLYSQLHIFVKENIDALVESIANKLEIETKEKFYEQ